MGKHGKTFKSSDQRDMFSKRILPSDLPRTELSTKSVGANVSTNAMASGFNCSHRFKIAERTKRLGSDP
ncbi:hypothetical protein BLOT_010161 [Blomia tropicalis]|nr:hypothetical protein BLOT_010161 [Blomia tropicalis]